MKPSQKLISSPGFSESFQDATRVGGNQQEMSDATLTSNQRHQGLMTSGNSHGRIESCDSESRGLLQPLMPLSEADLLNAPALDAAEHGADANLRPQHSSSYLRTFINNIPDGSSNFMCTTVSKSNEHDRYFIPNEISGGGEDTDSNEQPLRSYEKDNSKQSLQLEQQLPAPLTAESCAERDRQTWAQKRRESLL